MKQILNRIALLWLGLSIHVSLSGQVADRDWSMFPMEKGHFDQSWESLATYEVPEWFRDAKLGIWAIIGPQCVPMQGDWYARAMYQEGGARYKFHCENYGHPSEFGYKDLIELFNPEKLDFDNLVGLYKKAGAKYAVLLAVHHDNFDLWDSKYHEWNSVKKGPHRDLVMEFREATLNHNLRFGVTTHLARSQAWFQTSKGADTIGPYKGVPYDGNDPNYASLYHGPGPGSGGYPQNPPMEWEQAFYNRVKDLIDSYQPDLMYFDGQYPFPNTDGELGRRLVAHYYNANARWHNGDNQAAMCIKHTRPETCVLDIERGKSKKVSKYPWQTDTCIGGWYYKAGLKYKTVPDIIRMLIDIVSKNGNLLLNIPLHPSGSIDEDEENILKGLGEWMDINGNGLYGTRPWRVFGEGPSMSKEKVDNRFGGMKDVESFEPGDIRFVTKGENEIFAFLMAWPEGGEITIESLALSKSPELKPVSVTMLGVDNPLEFRQTDQGLVATLPGQAPCEHAWALRIQF